MALTVTSWAWEQDVKPAAAKLLLVGLADFARPCGHAWPSVGTLARRLGTTTRSVRTHLRALEKVELVYITHRRDSNGTQRSNLFRLAVAPVDPWAGGCSGLHHPGEIGFTRGLKLASPFEPSGEPPDQRLNSVHSSSRSKKGPGQRGGSNGRRTADDYDAYALDR